MSAANTDRPSASESDGDGARGRSPREEQSAANTNRPSARESGADGVRVRSPREEQSAANTDRPSASESDGDGARGRSPREEQSTNSLLRSSILARYVLRSIGALTLFVAGCGGDSGSQSEAPLASSATGGQPANPISDSVPSSAGGVGSDSSGSGERNEIDACSLITDAEATAVLGETFDRKTPMNGFVSTCEWHTASEYSITVEVGDYNTAQGNKLVLDPILGEPKPIEALGDQGASLPGGVVYFAADNRLNYLQVVSKKAGGADDQGAIELAVKLAAQIAAGS